MNRKELLPESTTLYPSKIFWALIILASIGFIALGIYLIGSDYVIPVRGVSIIPGTLFGQILCMIFSLVIFSSVLMLWPGSSWLKIGPDGIRHQVIFRKFHYRLSDISRFEIMTTQIGAGKTKSKVKFVSFWIKPDDQMRSLGECYGKTPEELLEILESYRNRYG